MAEQERLEILKQGRMPGRVGSLSLNSKSHYRDNIGTHIAKTES